MFYASNNNVVNCGPAFFNMRPHSMGETRFLCCCKTILKKTVLQQHKKRVSPIEWGRMLKNAGPQNGDSTGDCEGQARIQIEENVAFD